MSISASVTTQPISATVSAGGGSISATVPGATGVAASVSGGVGPQGPSGDAGGSATTSASDLTSGTLADARLSANVVLTNDARLSNSRTPIAHTHPLPELTQSGATTGQVATWNGSSWAPATPSSGSATTSASDLTTGTLHEARLSFVPLHPFLLMGG